MTDPITLRANTLSPLDDEGPTRVAVQLRAPSSGAERSPMNVVLVIDVSSSMRGEPLEHVRRAAIELVELLDVSDRVGVVTFSRHARILCAPERARHEHVSAVRAKLMRLEAERGTNFERALDLALGLAPDPGPGERTSVIFLTDGYPSDGDSDEGRLSALVERRGVGLSALGFGKHFHEPLVRALSRAGAGQVRFIEEPGLARHAFAMALGHHAALVADSLRVHVAPAPGVVITSAWAAAPVRGRGRGVEFELDAMTAGEAHAFAVEIEAEDEQGRVEDALSHVDVFVDGVDAHGEMIRESARAASPDTLDDERLARLAYWSARLDAVRRSLTRDGAPDAVRELEWLRADAMADFGADEWQGADALLAQLEDDIEALRHADVSTLARRVQADAESGSRTLFTSLTSARAARDSVRIFADAARESVDVGPAHLMLGTGRAIVFTVDAKPMTLGRATTCDVRLDDPSVSRKHARLSREAGVVFITDLGSTSGTRVNGKEILTRKLVDGDRVELGESLAVFRRGMPPKLSTPKLDALPSGSNNVTIALSGGLRPPPVPSTKRPQPASKVPELELPDGDRVVLLGVLVTIGSGPESDVVLNNPLIAPRHAYLARDRAGWVLRPASDRSVEVDARPIEEYRLLPGESFSLAGVGPFTLHQEA